MAKLAVAMEMPIFRAMAGEGGGPTPVSGMALGALVPVAISYE